MKKGEHWYTQMSRVFDAINNKQMEYNWQMGLGGSLWF